MTALGARLLVLGGRDYKTNSFDECLHCFDTNKNQWSNVPIRATRCGRYTQPLMRTGHCTDYHEGALLVFGGMQRDGNVLKDIISIQIFE